MTNEHNGAQVCYTEKHEVLFKIDRDDLQQLYIQSRVVIE